MFGDLHSEVLSHRIKASAIASKHLKQRTSPVLMLYQTVAQLSRSQIEHGPLALKRLFIMLRTRTHSPHQTIFVVLI
jgi:hypothetical protein